MLRMLLLMMMIHIVISTLNIIWLYKLYETCLNRRHIWQLSYLSFNKRAGNWWIGMYWIYDMFYAPKYKISMLKQNRMIVKSPCNVLTRCHFSNINCYSYFNRIYRFNLIDYQLICRDSWNKKNEFCYADLRFLRTDSYCLEVWHWLFFLRASMSLGTMIMSRFMCILFPEFDIYRNQQSFFKATIGFSQQRKFDSYEILSHAWRSTKSKTQHQNIYS